MPRYVSVKNYSNGNRDTIARLHPGPIRSGHMRRGAGKIHAIAGTAIKFAASREHFILELHGTATPFNELLYCRSRQHLLIIAIPDIESLSSVDL